MTNTARTGSGLKIIFSFFLGLVLTAFVGVGVYTFYPPPEGLNEEIRELNQREQSIRDTRAPERLTAEDLKRIEEINQQRNELQDAGMEAQRPWGRSTSIILIVCATIYMIVSLVRAEQIPVISNGLLLGGVFSMLYGIGWIIATDTSISRFLVITAALVITIGLGYARFVRREQVITATGGLATTEVATDLEQRLLDLETRLNEAARILGKESN